MNTYYYNTHNVSSIRS